MAEDNVQAAGFKLLVNGKELSPEVLPFVESIIVEDEIGLPAMVVIKFNTVNFEKGTFQGIHLETFKPGDAVAVFMGMDKPKEMMVGEITALDLTFGETSFMEIRGFDRLHRLRFGTKRRSFKDMKDSDIASSIASETGLSPQVDDTQIVHPYIFQNNMSNYEFLIERAKRIGYEMLVKDKQFIFRKSMEHKAPEFTLQYITDFESFSVQLRVLTRGSEVEVRGWDVKKKAEITSKAKKGSEKTKMAGQESGFELSQKAFGDSPVSILDNVVADASEAEKLAEGKYNTILKEFITGEGKSFGNPGIRAGKTAELKGLGDRFSGIYYIISTVHSINKDGYETTFKVRRTGV